MQKLEQMVVDYHRKSAKMIEDSNNQTVLSDKIKARRECIQYRMQAREEIREYYLSINKTLTEEQKDACFTLLTNL